MLCISAIISPASHGFSKNRLSVGISVFATFNCPDTRMILIGGQRSCTECASPKPSMLPGIWMSVSSSAMPALDSRIATAWSTSVLHNIDRPHAQQHLVFNDENDCGDRRTIKDHHDGALPKMSEKISLFP